MPYIEPVAPIYGGSLSVPIYDAPYTLPIPSSDGGPAFIKCSFDPIVTWNTAGSPNVCWQSGQGYPPASMAVNAIRLALTTYSGLSNNYFVNTTGIPGKIPIHGSNGRLYGISLCAANATSYAYTAGSLYNTSLLTPYADSRNNFVDADFIGSPSNWFALDGIFAQAPSTQGAVTLITPSSDNTLAPIPRIWCANWQPINGEEDAPFWSGFDTGPNGGLLYRFSMTDSGYFTSYLQEQLGGVFYNQTLFNLFQGDTIPSVEAANVILYMYYDETNPSCFKLYGCKVLPNVDSSAKGANVTFIGAFSVPGISGTSASQLQLPNAITPLGFLWSYASPNTGVILTPDGTTYFLVTLVPQSANATAALQSSSCVVTCDGNGIFWIAAQINSENFYIGNGSANILEPPMLLPLTSYPIPLACYTPCNVLKPGAA